MAHASQASLSWFLKDSVSGNLAPVRTAGNPELAENLTFGDNYFRKLSRSRDSDNQSEIPKNQHATGNELPPFFGVRRLVKERREASNNENEMADSTDGHHHSFKVLDLTCM